MIYGNFNHNFSICREWHSSVLFAAEVNFMTSEWYAPAPTAHVMVHSCRKFEEHWSPLRALDKHVRLHR